MKKIYIIVGGMGPQWLGKRIAQWVRINTKKQANAKVMIVDIQDVAFSPQKKEGSSRKLDIAEADGYILIAPEYESGATKQVHGLLSRLKQGRGMEKPVAFVSYGLEGGHGLVDSLRGVARSINLAPLRNAVHIAKPWEFMDQAGELHDRRQERHLSQMIRQLSRWMAVANA